MRKEVLLAIIFGVVLGGIILYGINLANKSVSSSPTENNPGSIVTPTPTISGKSVAIVSPLNHSVLTDKVVTLTGRATPASSLAIVSENDDLLIEASPEGTFSAQINLSGGENTITVTELKANNSLESDTVTIIQTATLPE